MRCSGIRMRRMRQHMIWIILLLCCCGGYGHNGGGCDAATAATTAVSGSFSFSAAAADGEMDAVSAADRTGISKDCGAANAALSVRSLCIFSFLRSVFLSSPLALLIDLVDSISIYDKSSHVFSSLGWSPFPYILFPCPLFRAFFA